MYQPHLKIVANGGMPGGERWSCGLTAHINNVAVSQGTLQNLANMALGNWSTAVGSSGLLLSSGVNLQRVDVRQVDAENRTVALAQASPTSDVKGVGLPVVPNQVAVVVSLRTGKPGARSRGRIYLPCLQANVNTEGRLASTQRTSITTAMKTLLDALNLGLSAEAFTSDGLTIESGVGAGASEPVRFIRVGDVFDTQRRRRDKIQEAYSQADITPRS